MKSWNINRRTLLRGAGASLALPWLEGMSWAAEASAPKARLAFAFFPFGVPMPPEDHPLRKQFGWFPTGEGADFEYTEAHQHFAPFREKMSYFGGLSHPLGRRVPGHKAGDVYLTGADISGSAYRQSISVDQVAANAVGDQTRFSSLVMSTSGGVNRPYRSFTLSYDRDGRPVPAQNQPKEIFRRLFGDEGSDQRNRLANQASVLDAIMGEASSLNRRLGKRDQEKMDEYLTSVREVEQQVDRAQDWLDVPKPVIDPTALNLDVDPAGPKDYIRSMYDLMVLAFQTDSTRVGTYQMASEEGDDVAATFPYAVGINKTSHSVSHARTDYEQWATYNQFLTQQYAYFLEKLDSVEEADGSTLLDNTMTMLGCCTSQTHVSRNYPLILSGGGNLGIQHGHYRKYDENEVPLSNLFVTMLDRMGTGIEKFKDSNGALTEIVSA
tara:strand:+ start:985 stop:2301 length:1317 start_codon:yes stop_codon:yes gene_type:complete